MGTGKRNVELAENHHVEYGTEPAVERKTAEPTVEEIKAGIAEKVRADSEGRSTMTPSETVFALVPASQQGRITALLEEIAADQRYPDIKAFTTASGMVFFFSTTFVRPEEAIAKCRVEEIKSMMADKIRADSRDAVALTPVGDLASVLTETERDRAAAIVNALETDERYADIKKVTAPNGDVYFHSDRHMSGYYALVLGRVAAKDSCATIAAMVRDESRIYPRPTCVQLFLEKPFDIPPGDLRTVVEQTLRKPENNDIKMLVHPGTGGVYLYSSLYMKEHTAFTKMDWVEVVKDANP